VSTARRYPPISDYALLGDCHSAALVSRDGSIDWCCFHRFDAHPVFGRILDWDQGGHFRIAPDDPASVTRRYLTDTNVLETRFDTGDGVLVVTDALAVQPEQGPQVHPFHQLLRCVRAERAPVAVTVEFVPRFDFGLTRPHCEAVEPGLWRVFGGADGLVLQVSGCDLDLDAQKSQFEARGTVTPDVELWCSVTSMPPHRLIAERMDEKVLRERLDVTVQFWQDWSARCQYDGEYRDAVVRSALVLKALTNAPTGAIVAAPTTSLPEYPGGTRNWDYRYTWVRDATIELYALFRLGYTEEADAFMRWLVRTTAGHCDDLQILYGVGGEHLVPEIELNELDGHRGSKPVRIGNAAVDQFQLDVYGHLLDAAWLYHRHGGTISDLYWSFLQQVVQHVDDTWQRPDSGIWEVRGDPKHFVLSKVMAWVAADRAIRLARDCGLPGNVDRWVALRDEIRAAVDEHGSDGEGGAFVQAFGEGDADAANLLIPLVRFVKPDDPRVRATVRAVQEQLTENGFVFRYRGCDDGVGGDEGTFVICTFWLVGNLALIGELDAARELFASVLEQANDVGLLAEEIDPRTGESLGNFPQAFSHVGLIGAAFNLERAAARTSPAPPAPAPS
jgi:GH15 family glucan-1,4-alpha-glucosidase